jgi:RNA polymerase sigma factor (sigma-70 family)
MATINEHDIKEKWNEMSQWDLMAQRAIDETRQPRHTSSTQPAPAVETPAPNPKMSPEEVEKLITDNIRLAYWFANQWSNIPGVSKEDIESQAIHGLVKAANTYDPAKGNFAGYASQVIRNYLGHLHFHQGEKTAMEPTSLDAPLGGDDEGGEDASLHDKYGDPKAKGSEMTTARAEATRIINDEIERIPEPDRSMVKRWMNGESYRDMQKDFNLSFMQIRNRVNAAMSNVKTNLAAKGILGLQDIWPESMADDMDGRLIFECLTAQVEISLALKNLQEQNVIKLEKV